VHVVGCNQAGPQPTLQGITVTITFTITVLTDCAAFTAIALASFS
jgi:hypothetical protein